MNPFGKYIKKRRKAVDFYLDIPKEAYDTQTYHKLRVEIKKINDFVHLLSYCIKGFKREKILKPYRRVFRNAGKLREVQIEEDMLVEESSVENIRNYKKNLDVLRLKYRKAYFTMVCKQRRRIDKMQHKLLLLSEQIDPESANHYLNICAKHANSLLNKNNLSRDKFHKLRKSIKRVNHILKCVNTTHRPYISSGIKGVSHLLGEWHDCQVNLKRIEQAEKEGKISGDESEEIRAIKDKLSSKRESLYLKIQFTLSKMKSEAGKTNGKMENSSVKLS